MKTIKIQTENQHTDGILDNRTSKLAHALSPVERS